MSGAVFINNNPTTLLTQFFSNDQHGAITVLMDENTKTHCYPLVEKLLPHHSVLEVAAGEEHKNLATCEKIWNHLTELNFDRHGLLVILGGGVLGDMGGFCAATYKRGIDFVIISTTLLAQVDASVGGKLGIDFNGFKNHIGVFSNPVATLICPQFLNTLPERELRSGFAEIIKHCLIADNTMWDVIRTKTLHQQDWSQLIAHSVQVKKKVVEEDPREKGLRKILNVGHSIGHAIESYYLNTTKKLYHGEAIAIGILTESYISHKKNKLSASALEEITAYLKNIYGKVALDCPDEEVINLMKQDKKNKENRMLLALADKIGSAIWDVEVTPDEVKEALNYYRVC